MPSKGTQLAAPCSTCAAMPEAWFYQRFSIVCHYVSCARLSGQRLVLPQAPALVVARDHVFTRLHKIFAITVRFPGLFFRLETFRFNNPSLQNPPS